MSEEEFVAKMMRFLKRYGRVSLLSRTKLQTQSKIYPFLVETKEQKFAAFAFKWIKSIGTNTIIRTEHMIKDLDCDGGIVIGPQFSQNTFDLVSDINNRGDTQIILLSFKDVNEIEERAS